MADDGGPHTQEDTPAAGAEAVGAAVESVWTRMREHVLARVDVLDDAVAALVERRLDDATRAEAERAAHKLAGSAGTFGFGEASRLARLLEDRFAGDPGPDDGRAAAEETVALRSALEQPEGGREHSGGEAPVRSGGEAPVRSDGEAAERAGPAASAVTDRATVVLLTADDELAAQLRAAAAPRRLDVQAAAAFSEARIPAGSAIPAAVVVDARLEADGHSPEEPGSSPDSTVHRAVAALSALSLPDDVLTLLLTETDAQPDRVAAARVGVDGFLPRAMDPDEVAAVIEQRLAASEAARVLACDDDVAVLEAIRAILEGSTLTVDTLADPAGFWSAMESTQPDLVLLDVAMPGVDGLELCRTLRSDPAHVALPVMFLTAYTDRASVQQAFEAGADDVIGKPLVDAELRVRVGNRLERARLLRRLTETDPVTGLDNRRTAMPALQRLLALAHRYEQPYSLAVLDLDRFERLKRVHGHAVGDTVLRDLGRRIRTGLRTSDVTARWGGGELVVGMYGADCHNAVRRLQELLDELRSASFAGDGEPFTATFSAGVAGFPDAGGDIDTLHRAAVRALRSAKHAGGAQVRAVSPDGEAAGQYDVAVVEDDVVLTDMLSHALALRGYQVEVLHDGAEARRRLVGETADLFPRMVLLDVDLPALNGLDLLGELRRGGILERTCVVMLTGRASEREVVEALRLGAVDHVAKPFSLPALLERVRHELAA